MIDKFFDQLLKHARKWWRPLACFGIVGTLIVNGIIIPIWNKEVPDLPGLAALIAAVSTALAVREYGKVKGVILDD